MRAGEGQDRCGWGREPRTREEGARQWHAWCMGASHRFRPWQKTATRATIRQGLAAAAISFGTFAGLLWLASEVIR